MDYERTGSYPPEEKRPNSGKGLILLVVWKGEFPTHNPTHNLCSLVRLTGILAVPVTAEVASSSLVVPAIPFQWLASISIKPTRVQKDTFRCPFCTLFRETSLTLYIPTFLIFTLRLSWKKKPVTVRLLEPHAWLA